MLLIPGLSSHGSVWDATVARYQDHYECHVITLPGFAGQPAIDHEDRFLEKMRDQLLAYLAAQDLSEVTVVGHSLGGFLSLSLASTEPDRFAQVVVVDGLPFLAALQMPGATPESVEPMAKRMREQMMAPRPEGYADMMRGMLGGMVANPEGLEKVVQWTVDSDPATVAQANYELYVNDLREDLSAITAPTLVMASWIAFKDYGVNHDMIERAYTAQYSKLKGAEIEITDVGRHFIMYDDPEFFFQHLDAVLKAPRG